MLNFYNDKTAKKVTYDENAKTWTHEDGTPCKAKNQNGTITVTFKSGLNADKQADKNAIYRVIVDFEDVDGVNRSYSLRTAPKSEGGELTQELLDTASALFKNGAQYTIGKRDNSSQNAGGQKADKLPTEFSDFETLAKSGVTDAPTSVFETIQIYWSRGLDGQKQIDELQEQIDKLSVWLDDAKKRKEKADAISTADFEAMKKQALADYNEDARAKIEKATAKRKADKLNLDKLDDNDVEKLLEKLLAEKAKRKADEKADSDED